MGHDAHHEELPFWRKYVFSVDHKVIGIQYAVTALVFLFFGFCLMMLMRWQLAYPGQPIPLIGGLFSDATAPGGIMLPEYYNQLGAMHGTIMVFLGVVPLVIASGASAKSQQALGTGVLGGMITATVLAVFMVPVFFVVVMRFFSRETVAKRSKITEAA